MLSGSFFVLYSSFTMFYICSPLSTLFGYFIVNHYKRQVVVPIKEDLVPPSRRIVQFSSKRLRKSFLVVSVFVSVVSVVRLNVRYISSELYRIIPLRTNSPLKNLQLSSHSLTRRSVDLLNPRTARLYSGPPIGLWLSSISPFPS